MNKLLKLALLVLLLNSCASRDKIVYMNNVENSQQEISNFYEPTIQPDDILSIIISSSNPELVKMFNVGFIVSQPQVEQSAGQQRLQSYMVDKDGYIDFPTLGRIKISDYTTNQAADLLKEKLKSQVIDITVNVRILNFKISVQGEVNRPGTHNVESQRITLLQALSMAGDLTIYGKRKNILIIREQNGKRTFNRVDITKSDFIDSDFYYLKQNDLVYVEPNNTKVNSSVVGPNVTLALSAASLLLSIIVVLTR